VFISAHSRYIILGIGFHSYTLLSHKCSVSLVCLLNPLFFMRPRNLVYERFRIMKFSFVFEKIRALSVRSDHLCIGNTARIMFVGIIGCTGIDHMREISYRI